MRYLVNTNHIDIMYRIWHMAVSCIVLKVPIQPKLTNVVLLVFWLDTFVE